MSMVPEQWLIDSQGPGSITFLAVHCVQYNIVKVQFTFSVTRLDFYNYSISLSPRSRTVPPVPAIVWVAGIEPGILSMWSCNYIWVKLKFVHAVSKIRPKELTFFCPQITSVVMTFCTVYCFICLISCWYSVCRLVCGIPTVLHAFRLPRWLETPPFIVNLPFVPALDIGRLAQVAGDTPLHSQPTLRTSTGYIGRL